MLVPGPYVLAEKMKEEDTLTISLLGDCSIGDAYRVQTYEESYATAVDVHGVAWPFSLVREYLDADDLTVANLEVVFTTKKRQADKRTNLVAKPKYAQVLLYSGINVLNTANNHSYDFYKAGFLESMETLDSIGMPYFGSPDPGADGVEDKLLVLEVKGVKLGFVGFTYPDGSDLPRLAERISRLRAEGCDLVIASLHWGRELQRYPGSGQPGYARQVLEAGADVVYGHHPHILQPVQFYNGKPVFYSLGNFSFGAIGTSDRETGIFQLRYRVTKEGPVLENFSVIPCRYYGSEDYRPYAVTEDQLRQSVFKRLMWKRETDGMQNLPASFAKTGSVDFANGEMLP